MLLCPNGFTLGDIWNGISKMRTVECFWSLDCWMSYGQLKSLSLPEIAGTSNGSWQIIVEEKKNPVFSAGR